MKKIIFAVLIFALLTACGNAPTTTLLTPNPSAPANSAFLTTSCATIYSSVPADVKLNGMAVLDDYKLTSNLFLKDLQSGKQISLATVNDTVSTMRVSPDHKSLGYILGSPKTGEWNFIIADAQGQRKTEAPWKDGFFTLGNWVNNEEITMLSFPPFVIYNPFSKEEKNFEFTDFPGYLVDPNNNRTVEIDSFTQKAVYQNSNGKVALYDIPSKKVLAEVPNQPAPTIIAAWAPDASQVAVLGTIMLTDDLDDRSVDVFSISRDGQVKRLTHLTDHYGKLVNIYKSGFSWSPDSRSIAFWGIYRQNGYKYWELIVHDTTTDQSTNYCILNDYESELNPVHSLPIPAWSPDGKQLLVENRYDKKSNRVLVLDLASKNAYQIDENKYVAGWIIP